MERFGDDVLGLILNRINDPDDRDSFSKVCKQCLRVEGLTRLCLRVLEPELIPNFIPRFPNLVSFQCAQLITDAEIELLAKTCPYLQILNLNLKESRRGSNEFDDVPVSDDVGDYGLCAIAKGCRNLRNVYLRRRCQIRSLGVVSLVNSAQNLLNLDLGRCTRVSDLALEAIGQANSLQALSLEACWLITDRGLASLSCGSLSKTLKRLVIAECDRITDKGILCLREFSCLEDLNLGECGPQVTDIGGMAIASIQTLKRLNLSWLINVSDATLVALAENCLKLQAIDLTGCESITGDGIRAFVNHNALEELVLARCQEFSGEDLEELVLECQKLRYIGLDKHLRFWIPTIIQQNIQNCFCLLDWI